MFCDYLLFIRSILWTTFLGRTDVAERSTILSDMQLACGVLDYVLLLLGKIKCFYTYYKLHDVLKKRNIFFYVSNDVFCWYDCVYGAVWISEFYHKARIHEIRWCNVYFETTSYAISKRHPCTLCHSSPHFLRFGDFHYDSKTVWRPSYLDNGPWMNHLPPVWWSVSFIY